MVGPRPLETGPPAADPDGRPTPTARRPRPTPWPRTGDVAEVAAEVAAAVSGNGHAPTTQEHNAREQPPAPSAVAEVPAVPPPASAEGPDVWGLVRRVQDGDAEAFGEIYDHYVGLVHRYVYHRVGDRTMAEDVTSETFVRALRRIDTLSFQGRDVGAWLVTIARNIVFDHVKSSRYRLEVTTADMRDADTATDGPEDAVVQRLTNEALVECIRKLGPEQQECLTLRFLQGLSVSETAQVMGKRDGAIKALQHRAVKRLAGLLPEGLR
jgi:RNA polymerase sigma-70 factor (TIGR02952 family)